MANTSEEAKGKQIKLFIDLLKTITLYVYNRYIHTYIRHTCIQTLHTILN